MHFPDFLGNPGAKALLQTAFDTGRFPHAVLIQGEPGSGRRTLAKLLARALVCHDPANAPCGACPACRRALAGSHPDIRVIEGKGPGGGLVVEQVTSLAQDAQRMPDEASYSVYILLLGENTGDAPQNKLLKLIEEPPRNVVFILVCRQASSLLPTVFSRAQLISMLPPPVEEASAWFAREKGIPEKDALHLSQLCGGNLGRMLGEWEAQEKSKGGKPRGLQAAQAAAEAMARGLTARGGHDLLAAAGPLLTDRDMCREALNRLELIFRDACVRRGGGRELRSGAPEELVEKLSRQPMEELVQLPACVLEHRGYIERNANLNLLVTHLCARLRALVERT